MKTLKLFMGISLLASTVLFNACQSEQVEATPEQEEVSQEVLTKIHELGFSTHQVLKAENGYIVEGDILITEEALCNYPERLLMRVGTEEQYHTSNLVTGLPRVVTVSVDKKLPDNFTPATEEAIARYNNEDLQITFQLVSSNGDIKITAGPKWWNRYGILGMGGFPTADGEPYNSIQMNASAFRRANIGYLATVLAHEMGHNIGFRHTDYMDRSYSCGGAYDNEGQSEYGAIHIPGTPASPEQRSWMLSCSDGSDRPFTNNDKVALDYLY